MATHFSILSWRIPWTEEPGRLQSIKSQRVRHDWSNLAVTAEHFNSQWFQCLKSQGTKINISFTIFSFFYTLKFYYLLFWQKKKKTLEATKQSQFYPLITKISLHHFSLHGHFFWSFSTYCAKWGLPVVVTDCMSHKALRIYYLALHRNKIFNASLQY